MQLSVDTPASGITDAEPQFIDQTTEIMQRHTSKISSTPVLQDFMSPILGCHDNAQPEDEAVEDIDGTKSACIAVEAALVFSTLQGMGFYSPK